jgi:hypothetical protein
MRDKALFAKKRDLVSILSSSRENTKNYQENE